MKETFPHSRKTSHRQVCGSFIISEGNITERKTKQNTDSVPNSNCNCQKRSSLDAHICHQRVGAGQEGTD